MILRCTAKVLDFLDRRARRAQADERFLNRFLRRTPHERDGRYVTPLDLVNDRR
jgi:hypothetical protein